MRADSSLSVEQREAAVAWFEQGLAADATARLVGAPRNPVQRLYLRWRVRGEGALVGKSTKSYYSFEFKLELVERLLAGQASAPELAAAAGLSSPKLLANWARVYRRDGPEGLRPKRRGRPSASGEAIQDDDELSRLRAENERLRAQVAFLGKLQALSEPEPR